jgi:hypothetical protein
MGVSVIPASSASTDTWVQIGTTQTPTSGTTVSFTSITAAKKIRIVVKSVVLTSSSTLRINFNGDSGTNYFNAGYRTVGGVFNALVTNTAQLAPYAANGSTHIHDLLIDYASQVTPKFITGFGTSSATDSTYSIFEGTWNSTAVINQIDFTTSSTFNATNTGTIAIYGAY